MAKDNSWVQFEYPKNLIMALGIESIEEDKISKAQIAGALYCIETLNDKQKYILIAYFKEHKTLGEIAKHLKLSEHSTATLANKALAELKQPSRLKYIINRKDILSDFTKAEVTTKYGELENKQKNRLKELEMKIGAYEKGISAIEGLLGDKSNNIRKILNDLEVESTQTYIYYTYPYNFLNDVFYDRAPKELCREQLAGLEYVISKLDQREKDLINLRYIKKLTYDEIGKKYEISRERVRQILNCTIRKCRCTEMKNYILYGFSYASGKISREVEDKYMDVENAKRRQIAELDSEYLFLEQSMQAIRELIGDKYALISSKMTEIKKHRAQYRYDCVTELYNRGEMSVRTYNVIRRRVPGEPTLQELSSYTVEDVLKWRNAGRKTVEELVRLMDKYGLAFRVQ